LARIAEYELRIEALTRTLAICDDDLAKYVSQRKEIQLIVGEYKRSEMLREAVENEAKQLREVLRYAAVSTLETGKTTSLTIRLSP
jgi:chorismate mutase